MPEPAPQFRHQDILDTRFSAAGAATGCRSGAEPAEEFVKSNFPAELALPPGYAPPALPPEGLYCFYSKVFFPIERRINHGVIDVSSDFWAVAAGHRVVSTGPLNPCSAIVLYERQRGIAVVGHFVCPEYCEADLQLMLEHAAGVFPDKSIVAAYAGGAAGEYSDAGGWRDQEVIDLRRGIIAENVRSCGFDLPREHVCWNEPAQCHVIMHLDLRTAEFQFLKFDPLDRKVYTRGEQKLADYYFL